MQVDLFYRDGANYKDHFSVEIDDRFKGIVKVAEHEDDFTELEDMGLSVRDIPMVRKYGYEPDFDHNLVLVEAVR